MAQLARKRQASAGPGLLQNTGSGWPLQLATKESIVADSGVCVCERLQWFILMVAVRNLGICVHSDECISKSLVSVINVDPYPSISLQVYRSTCLWLTIMGCWMVFAMSVVDLSLLLLVARTTMSNNYWLLLSDAPFEKPIVTRLKHPDLPWRVGHDDEKFKLGIT